MTETVCMYCRCTWETMERVGGEPAGWALGVQPMCLGPKCTAQRAALSRIVRRKQARQLADAKKPIVQKINDRRREKRERAKRRKAGK